ncbi:MAG: ABC transporter permease subunit [Haloarculaceae archaeon]
MSVRTVARRDFTAVRRSQALWAVATLLAVVTALIAFGYQGYRLTPLAETRQLFGQLGMLFAVLVPIVALVASYMSIAGERDGGGIKFLLGFPNTRREVFLGKLASRAVVVAGGLTFAFATATSVAVARHGVLPWRTVLGLFGVTLLYATVFVGVAVALSAAVATKTRAIAAAVGSYFVLVILYVLPTVRMGSIVAWVHHTMLGFAANPDLYDAVTYTSPYIAYRKATNLVVAPAHQATVFRRSAEAGRDLPVYLSDEFALVVFAIWLVVPLLLGYRRFERSDLE